MQLPCGLAFLNMNAPVIHERTVNQVSLGNVLQGDGQCLFVTPVAPPVVVVGVAAVVVVIDSNSSNGSKVQGISSRLPASYSEIVTFVLVGCPSVAIHHPEVLPNTDVTAAHDLLLYFEKNCACVIVVTCQQPLLYCFFNNSPPVLVVYID